MAQLVKILSKGGDRPLYMAIRDDMVVLAHEDPRDKTQQWFKDCCSSGNVTDDNGQRAFALVNQATRQAMVNKKIRRPDRCIQVQLAPYKGDERVDISMLWTQREKKHGDDFHQIGALRDTTKVLDGLTGILKDGTIVGVDPSHDSYDQPIKDNQLWKILPVSSSQ